MKENYGAFNRSNYYFSLNRQNSKFQLQGLIYYFEKGVIEKHQLDEMVLFNIYKMDWEAPDFLNQMYLFFYLRTTKFFH